jgi:hypothetical protein
MRKCQNYSVVPMVSQRVLALVGQTLAGDKLQKAGKSCRALSVAIIGTFLLAACATQEMDRPVAQMTRAETTIQSAIEAGARETAPLELRTAQQHFSRAQEASSNEEYTQAFRLAEKAEADAQLAEAKARTAEAYSAVAELNKGIQALQEELQRETTM